jgi:hypothetical protein
VIRGAEVRMKRIGYPRANLKPTMLEQRKPPQNLTCIRVQSLTDQSRLCYNSFTGQGQLLWVGVCLQQFGRRFNLVSIVSINLRIWFYGVEKGDAGETIEREESH